ncbi:hypothetical protein GIB67_038055 [Kingdonia uniflora]|uniref:Uncharacterized protein n=1 Tax=Kingdonia uniflora TaxID=39325 RepID=A0A7J7L775_9MAGN|nr:hypothetical protein GIB67_038055 [Kingdonia uniflora]
MFATRESSRPRNSYWTAYNLQLLKAGTVAYESEFINSLNPPFGKLAASARGNRRYGACKGGGVETLQMVVGRPFNSCVMVLVLLVVECDLVLPKFEVAVYWNESRVSYGGGDAYSVAITVMKAYYKLN